MKPYPKASRKQNGFHFLGLTLHNVCVQEVHDYIGHVIERCEKALVLNLNVHCVNLACKHEWLRKFLNEAQLVFCDGDGVRWGVKLLGETAPPKITYAKWMWQLAEYCAVTGYSLYFIGAKPGVAEKAAAQLKGRFPDLKIQGVRHGYFERKGPENETIIREINSLSPDIVVTGFGMPAQEEWLLSNWERIDAHIFLTGGAVFDYVSGNLGRAPDWMIKMQMEWLYRLFQEPRRLFSRYMIGNPLFFIRIFKEKIRGANKKK